MADVMRSAKPWTPSSFVPVMAGICLIGAGSYFILLRPPLLPEDTFMIDPDFKWVLLAMALLWACSLLLFRFENRARY